jgi:hypothetical protein
MLPQLFGGQRQFTGEWRFEVEGMPSRSYYCAFNGEKNFTGYCVWRISNETGVSCYELNR